MAVFVDAIRRHPDTQLIHDRWCHMVADSEDELHEIARIIDMPPRAFQGPTFERPWRLPHYDLTPEKRALALKSGAITIEARELGRRVRAHREAIRREPKGAGGQQSTAP